VKFDGTATSSRRSLWAGAGTVTSLVASADQTVTEDICSEIVLLPVHGDMALADVACVVTAVQEGASQ
jgi:dTDP-4-amino-4,6-dideoxygalactose transaminase